MQREKSTILFALNLSNKEVRETEVRKVGRERQYCIWQAVDGNHGERWYIKVCTEVEFPLQGDIQEKCALHRA